MFRRFAPSVPANAGGRAWRYPLIRIRSREWGKRDGWLGNLAQEIQQRAGHPVGGNVQDVVPETVQDHELRILELARDEAVQTRIGAAVELRGQHQAGEDPAGEENVTQRRRATGLASATDGDPVDLLD